MQFGTGGAQIVSLIPALWVTPLRGGTFWWEIAGQTCVAAYQPKGAASLAASYVNLANPGTYDAAPGVAPTFDAATGWTFNGSTQYLMTGVVPSSGWSMAVRFANVSPASTFRVIVGSQGVGNTRFYIAFGSNPRYVYGNGYVNVIDSGLTNGVLAHAAQYCYKDGVSDGQISDAFSGTGKEIYVGAHNSIGVLEFFLSCQIQAVSIYSTTLSAGNNTTLAARMNAL